MENLELSDALSTVCLQLCRTNGPSSALKEWGHIQDMLCDQKQNNLLSPLPSLCFLFSWSCGWY